MCETNVKVFHFLRKKIKDFNFNYKPRINKDVINDLSTLRFIEEKRMSYLWGTMMLEKSTLLRQLKK